MFDLIISKIVLPVLDRIEDFGYALAGLPTVHNQEDTVTTSYPEYYPEHDSPDDDDAERDYYDDEDDYRDEYWDEF